MPYIGKEKSFFDMEKFREDVKPFLSDQDVEILIQLYNARRADPKVAVQEVALLLGLTQGRIRHRFFKAVDYLRRLAGYAVLFERILDGDEAEPETPKAN